MKRFIKISGFAATGLFMVIAGFIYDVLFAGIPYQDPTPEMQADWESQGAIAGLLYKTGGIVLLLGLILIPIIWMKTRNSCKIKA